LSTQTSDWFQLLAPWRQALMAGCFTWGITALGAAVVFVTPQFPRQVFNGMLGFAAGVMIAASFWSLLLPAGELAAHQSLPSWVPMVVGFLLGGLFLRISDAVIPHLHPGAKRPEGANRTWKRTTLLVSAITLHNIPEGLAVGVAFGALGSGIAGAETHTLGAAVALALGIGLQNFPEGASISLPLRGEGVSRLRSFWFGQLSGFVEPVAAVAGAVAVTAVEPLLPYALAFAAGAMIYVVVEELIPGAQEQPRNKAATFGAIMGFALMMGLDVALS
jgi:ZIP family zinc transporter